MFSPDKKSESVEAGERRTSLLDTIKQQDTPLARSLRDKTIMSSEESLEGGNELPKAISDAIEMPPIEYAKLGGESLKAYPGIHYQHRSFMIPGSVSDDETYYGVSSLVLSYYPDRAEARVATEKTFEERKAAIAKHAEEHRKIQEVEAWRQDFRSRLSKAKEKLDAFKRIAENRELNLHRSEVLLEAMRLHEHDDVMYPFTTTDNDGATIHNQRPIDTLYGKDKPRLETYLEKISNVIELESLVHRLRVEQADENAQVEVRRNLWNKAKDFASLLEQESKGLRDSVYATLIRKNALNPESNPDFLEAQAILDAVYRINTYGHRLDAKGALQKLNPDGMPKNLGKSDSEEYARGVSEIVEQLGDLERRMQSIKTKFSFPTSGASSEIVRSDPELGMPRILPTLVDKAMVETDQAITLETKNEGKEAIELALKQALESILKQLSEPVLGDGKSQREARIKIRTNLTGSFPRDQMVDKCGPTLIKSFNQEWKTSFKELPDKLFSMIRSHSLIDAGDEAIVAKVVAQISKPDAMQALIKDLLQNRDLNFDKHIDDAIDHMTEADGENER